MDVFLSWSGPRSKAVAEAFSRWLPKLIQAVDPWISTEIEKGDRWSHEISKRLEKTRIGIFCLTSDNLGSPWLHFEAGAISKMSGSRACTFLLDVKSEDVKPPLGLFQNTRFEKKDVLKLILLVNENVATNGEKAPSRENLIESFELLWPAFQKELSEIPAAKAPAKPGRSDSDKLDELLTTVRGVARKIDEGVNFPPIGGGSAFPPSTGVYWIPPETGTFTGSPPPGALVVGPGGLLAPFASPAFATTSPSFATSAPTTAASLLSRTPPDWSTSASKMSVFNPGTTSPEAKGDKKKPG